MLDGGAVKLFASVKPRDVVDWLADLGPQVVAVDSPYRPAPPGRRSRKGERKLAAARDLPNVRPTPDLETLSAREDGYYDWVLNGFRLYERLEKRSRKLGWEVVECFPTASWTRWAGPRVSRSRSGWTREALGAMRLSGVPPRTSQDVRDAIAAAVTAAFYADGYTERFGRIVVPA